MICSILATESSGCYNRGDVVTGRIGTIPRFGRERIILHAFSGRRRWGDLQCLLESCEVPPGTTYHVISLDIVVSSQHGNIIMDPAVRAFWVHGARQGIHSFVAGPPCETWSQARENDLGGGDDDYKGPRVLRTAARPPQRDQAGDLWGHAPGFRE